MGKKGTKRKDPQPDSDAEPVELRPAKKTKQTKKSAEERDQAFLTHFASKHDKVDLEKEEDEVNTAILAVQMCEWKRNKTECYDHYRDPKLVKEKGVWKYKFTCKRYPSKTVTRARYHTSTSNLVTHARGCNPCASNSIKKYTTGGDYDVGRFRTSLALWIAVRNRPHLAVTDPELVDTFKTLQPNVHVPSNDTVGEDIKRIEKLTKPAIIELFKKHDCVFHGMLDGWTAANVLASVGLGVQPRARGNASGRIARINLATRIHCLAHILNLIVKAFLSLFVPRKGEVGDSNEDEDEHDTTLDEEYIQALEEVDESVKASDAQAIAELDEDKLLNARDLDIILDEDDRRMARDAYRKLTRLGHRIFNSELLRKQLVEIALSLKIPSAEKKRMLRAILTRWNSVTDMLLRGLELQPALDRLCLTSTGRASIKSLLLSNEQWQLMYQVQNRFW
ncbi:Dimer-Tnp-hAT domain-containing protein [Mycena chlorophos]|uniref:Dimer-Tnp-hAT domain-containing protein n=1 Tax=Mycena chlorophos TaxID=658473 RepID=A0A8H6TM81_MYCCL|nr:Dimer-Tnp-hAT domain-containing protein [Mycena chlorophos]